MDPKEHAVSVSADEDIGTNLSSNPQFSAMIEARLTRRQALKGGLSAATAAIFGGLGGIGLAGCSNDDAEVVSRLGFAAVPKSLADLVAVPSGYNVSVLWALGDPFTTTDPAWSDAGTETAESYNRRAGDHHDGMYYFGLSGTGSPDASSSTRGVLAMNHEAPNPFIRETGANNLYVHPSGASTSVVGGVATRTDAEEVRKEINHHGVSIIEITKTGSNWAVVKDSTFNHRVTAATTMDIRGPLRGNAALITKFSTDATQTQGTVNNCANGYTPWGTYLTCEENWAGYFARATGDDDLRSGGAAGAEVTALKRYGNSQGALQRLNWNTAGSTDEFQRWDTSITGATAADDFRNVINQFGYVVEIDPYDKAKTPVKRTHLGRFAHEGAWPAKVTAGKPLVWYMGDDNRNDYIYKYVSTANWDAADATASDRMATGSKYLDSGKLYVAKFNADGSGSWVELTGADAYLNTRLAADAAGATKMDRPEWGAVNPDNGEVYFTLTNNSNRRVLGTAVTGSQLVTDAANPRAYSDAKGSSTQQGNVNGHIIRWRETGNDPAATSFTWDIFLFGAQSDADPATINLSGLSADNDLSSPDGLWFARSSSAAAGLLWIETDDGAYTDVTNCMLLAAVPGTVGDGGTVSVGSQATRKGKNLGSDLRRFLTGPKECEITGLETTPDGKALFVNIQHPGEDKAPTFSDPSTFGSRWPGNQFASTHPGNRPRSATLVITRADGGIVGL